MIYVYVGSDSAYLKLQIRRKYIQTKVALEDTEFLSFSGYEDLIQDVVEDVRSPSFTANKKIIVMDKCYFLSNIKERTPRGNEHSLPALKDYILDPDPVNDLYLLVIGSLAKNEVTDLLKKKAEVKTFPVPDDKELKRIAVDYFTIKQIKFEQNAIEELVKRVKGNYSQLMMELEKLENVEDKVGIQEVSALVYKPLEDNIFNLTTFMLQGQLSSALGLYHDLLMAGNDPYYLLAIMAGQIRFIAAVSFALSRYMSEQEIATELQAKPYRVTVTKRLINGRKPMYFYNILAGLFELDRNFKLYSENLSKSLELFIVNNTRK